MSKESRKPSTNSVYNAWLASRQLGSSQDALLVPGANRPFNLDNVRALCTIARTCAPELFRLLWDLHPFRTTAMLMLNVIQSLVPAFRGYSQALLIDELQLLITSGNFTWSRCTHLAVNEIIKRILEGLIDSFAVSNELIVHRSARFFVEYKQLEQRVRLDIPTSEDPLISQLIQESDMFARSFTTSLGGLLSPLDFIRIVALCFEALSHMWILVSLTMTIANYPAIFLTICTSLLPLLVTWSGFSFNRPESLYTAREGRAAERQERLRGLAYSSSHRPEIILFGLGPWILSSWSRARSIVMNSEEPILSSDISQTVLNSIRMSDFLGAIQNIPLALLLEKSSASFGSLNLYQRSLHSLVFTSRSLLVTIRMAWQSFFLMGAFCAAMEIKPKLQPEQKDMVSYESILGGVKIEIKSLFYTYPGNKEASLKNISMTINPGETLAIVGFNGSGKSTLAKIILRLLDFDQGSIFVNGVDIRRYNPWDYHRHITSVSQNYSKFDSSTVKENVGIGAVDMLSSYTAVEDAIHLAGADPVVASLPHGLRTRLGSSGFEAIYPPGMGSTNTTRNHGLSGGEWQRIAIARAFMRLDNPDVELLVFDEPTSSLDSHAQNNIFDTINQMSRDPDTGTRTKTVIFITHRLNTARRADKIAMMSNGSLLEFGTHQKLLENNGEYAALYRASV